MASSTSHNHNNTNDNIKIHDHCFVAPTSATQTSLPLTFFDLFWIRFHPVERVFFYSLQSDPSFFFDKVVPKLKTSLSHALQHFPPLAGNIVWPSDSPNPIIQYTPGDAVSVFIAESYVDFDHILDDSPHETAEPRCLVPHLESSDSRASAISFQITLFPNRGFSIGISTHHAVADGKASTLFIKAWASLCQTDDESPSLVPEFKPFFDREGLKDPRDMGINYTLSWDEVMAKLFPHEKSDGRSLKILPIQPKLEDTVRATFLLSRGDLEKLKKRVLSKWDMVGEESKSNASLKPTTLSSFALTCAYTLVCIAKAIHGVESKRQKFAFGFTVDCRARLEPPIPDNFFGNCVWGCFVDTEPLNFIKEEGMVLVAKSIYNTIKMIGKGKEVFQGGDDILAKYMSLAKEGVEVIGVAGSNRFGVYGIDFGWGKPSKVEIASVDRALTMGLADSKDGKGGLEVGLVLNKHVMDLFHTFFHGELCDD